MTDPIIRGGQGRADAEVEDCAVVLAWVVFALLGAAVVGAGVWYLIH